MEKITLDTILDWFKEATESKIPISPSQWVEAALKLNILIEDIDDEICLCEGLMAEDEAKSIEEGKTAAMAKRMRIRAIPYTDYLKLKAKRTRITEFIRLAKKRSEIRPESF